MRVIDILLDKKSNKTYKNTLTYSWHFIKNFYGCKTIAYLVRKIDGFTKIYDGIRYLVLFASERFNAIYNSIKHLISEKSGITDGINYNFARIRIDSDNFLPTQKMLAFHNVIILIKSVINKNKYNYHHNALLEKGSNEDKSNRQYFDMNVCIL